MGQDKNIQKLREKFAGKIVNWQDRSQRRIYIDVNSDDIPEMAEYLFKDLKARFIIASGVDLPGSIEILYHFSFDKTGLVVSLRTSCSKPDPEIASIAPTIRAAEWIEREIWELLGVNFKGHPKLERLLMSEDWPEGVYPLRQEPGEGNV